MQVVHKTFTNKKKRKRKEKENEYIEHDERNIQNKVTGMLKRYSKRVLMETETRNQKPFKMKLTCNYNCDIVLLHSISILLYVLLVNY